MTAHYSYAKVLQNMDDDPSLPNYEPKPEELAIRQAFGMLSAQRILRESGEPNIQIPHLDKATTQSILEAEDLPEDILLTFAEQLKYEADEMASSYNHKPYYWQKLQAVKEMNIDNLRKLYNASPEDNALIDMLNWEATEDDRGTSFIGDALDVVKLVNDTTSIPELIDSHPDDPVFTALTEALQSGKRSIEDFLTADIGYEGMNGLKVKQRTPEMRRWMRGAVMMATGITDPEEADTLTYSASRDVMGTTVLNELVGRIKELGAEKIDVIRKFANISTLSSYSNEQLELMYQLAQGDQEQIDRLRQHDVNVALINLDGDHNGVASEVASRLDDEAQRTLFFEINTPQQIYQHLKKLHEMGIAPSTLIFASHGNRGQFVIGQRPPLDEEQTTDHVVTIMDQVLADKITADSQAEGEKVVGYDIDNSNGLVRSIQRFMQPSRGIDDADKDVGRKKIISLSCQFATTGTRYHLGPEGEPVPGERTSMIKRLGEVIVGKLPNEHIDIYGADISTNQQTRTERGFHYNQARGRRWEMYPASVLHINGRKITRGRVREIQLRK